MLVKAPHVVARRTRLRSGENQRGASVGDVSHGGRAGPMGYSHQQQTVCATRHGMGPGQGRAVNLAGTYGIEANGGPGGGDEQEETECEQVVK